MRDLASDLQTFVTSVLTLATFAWSGIVHAQDLGGRPGGRCSGPGRADMEEPAEGRVLTNAIGMKLVRIPPGEFLMGSHDSLEALAAAYPEYGPERIAQLTDDRPPHKVRITRPFFMGMHEITIGQFRRFVEEAGYRTEPERDDAEALARSRAGVLEHELDDPLHLGLRGLDAGFALGDDPDAVDELVAQHWRRPRAREGDE